MTVAVLNDYRLEHSLTLFGYTAVYNCYVRMKPMVVTFKKRQQGSPDPASGWAIVRLKIFKQVLIRQDNDNPNDQMFDADRDEDGNLPSYYKKENLTPIDPCKI